MTRPLLLRVSYLLPLPLAGVSILMRDIVTVREGALVPSESSSPAADTDSLVVEAGGGACNNDILPSVLNHGNVGRAFSIILQILNISGKGRVHRYILTINDKCMYVYIYVCMYVCMYLCLYISTYVLYIRMYVLRPN
jgi:hypothetical protein